ncbi:hypothetical protein LHK13_03064 [Providencia rettgeri]|nr:hypothetical protein [Providencia rettgeri]
MANTYLPSTLNPERVVTSCATFADAPCVGVFLSVFLAKFHALTMLKLLTQRNYKYAYTICRLIRVGNFLLPDLVSKMPDIDLCSLTMLKS